MSYNIYVENQTDQSISFVFFQENNILDENSYSVVWEKKTVAKGEKAGPIVLPSDVSVSIHSVDKSMFFLLHYFQFYYIITINMIVLLILLLILFRCA